MLITSKYLQEQKRLHAEDPIYATIGHKWAYLVAGIAIVERCRYILDYGCGKGTLTKELTRGLPEFVIWEYDPAVPGKDLRLAPADLIVCTDVMEHIEPDCLEAVLYDLARLTRKFLFLVISTKFDKRRQLSDGRNSHLIVNEGEWWEKHFTRYQFKVKRTWNTGVKEWVALLEKTN